MQDQHASTGDRTESDSAYLTAEQWMRVHMPEVEQERRLEEEDNMRLMPDGTVLSGMSGVAYEEPDGTIVDTTPRRGDHRLQSHRNAVSRFRVRAIARSLASARRRGAPAQTMNTRRARSRAGGRRRVRCTRSARASGDSPEDDSHHHEPFVVPRPAETPVFLCPRTVVR